MNKVLKENSIIKEALDEIIKSEVGYVDNLADLAGPESSWMGEDGWKNKGWPTLKNTTAVLGTLFSGGAYGTFVGTSAWGTGATIWNTTSLGVGVYNAADGISGGQLPGSKFMNDTVGLEVDIGYAKSGTPHSNNKFGSKVCR